MGHERISYRRPYFMNSSVAHSAGFLYKNYHNLHFYCIIGLHAVSITWADALDLPSMTLVDCNKLFITVICKNATGLKDAECSRTFISHIEKAIIKLAKKHLRFTRRISGISWITRSTSCENCAHKKYNFQLHQEKGL